MIALAVLGAAACIKGGDMNFIDAVRSVLTQPVRFTGRSRRAEFWWFALFEFLVVVIASLIDVLLHSPVLVVVVGVIMLLPALAVSVRRLHDTGRSGWWVLVELLPFVGLIWLFALCAEDSERGENRYGMSPKHPVNGELRR
jgi:uncharacterized membrane protein YhaH (DUF805 family)